MPDMHGCRADTQIDVPGLVNGTRHRHQCFVLNRVCLFNGTILPAAAGGQAEQRAKQLASTLTVRSMFGSHQTFKLGYLHPMDAATPQSPAAKLVRRAVSREGFSRCVPLVWVPTWAFSFAEHFINSVVPVHELMEAGLIDEHVLLRPDLNSRPMGRYGFYQMLSALSAERTAGLRDAGPKCTDRHATREGGPPPWCVPRCYQRLVICNFRSTFDAYAARMAPWSAAQRVARRLVPRPPPAEPAVAARHVLLVNRTGTRFARSLHNLPQLLAACAHSEAPRTICTAHEFGRRGVAADVAAARRADVLVGTHGAALTYGFYMRRGAALVEVRPYRFEGKWPDRYFRDLASLEQTPLYFQVMA